MVPHPTRNPRRRGSVRREYARQIMMGCVNLPVPGGPMIRPEFKKILLDQRGAAVILWSFFVISIPIYNVIARYVLANPNVGTNPAIAEPARIIFWLAYQSSISAIIFFGAIVI
jgi:hypothetical protein